MIYKCDFLNVANEPSKYFNEAHQHLLRNDAFNESCVYLSLECPKHFKRTFLKMGLSRPLFLLFSSFQYKTVDNK